MEVNNLNNNEFQYRNPESGVPQEETAGNFVLLEYLFLAVRHWYWLLLGLILGLAGANLYLRYAPVVYSASATILVADAQQQGVTEQALLGELGIESESKIEDQIEVFRSFNLMKRVVDSLGLSTQVTSEGRIKTTEQYGLLSLIRLDSMDGDVNLKIRVIDSSDYEIVRDKDATRHKFNAPVAYNGKYFAIRLLSEDLPEGELIIHSHNPASIARAYAGALKVEKFKQANVIGLSIQDEVPRKITDILEELLVAFNESAVEEKNMAGKNTLAFIDERLNYIARELYDVESEVQNFKQVNKLTGDVTTAANEYLTQISVLESQLLQSEVEQSLIDNIKSTLNDAELQ